MGREPSEYVCNVHFWVPSILEYEWSSDFIMGRESSLYMYICSLPLPTICAGFTGIDSAYEPPLNPDLVLKAGELGVQECVEKVVDMLADKVHTNYPLF